MRRHLRRMGHRTAVVLGIDRFDSHVVRSAKAERRTPTQSANSWTARIVRDLDYFAIDIDCIAHAGDPVLERRLIADAETLLEDLDAKGAIRVHREFMPIAADGTGSAGYALLGACPVCLSDMAGYFCEECANCIAPDELLNPRLPKDAHWEERENLFLTAAAANWSHICQVLDGNADPRGMLLPMARRFRATGQEVRLTTIAAWGLQVPGRMDPGQVFFNSHSMEYPRLGARVLDSAINPFAAGSDVVSVYCFGFDNSACVIGELSLALSRPRGKGFDHYIGSHFLLLEGEKFSTSRGYAIFVRDLERLSIPVDPLRLYLAGLDLGSGRANFRLAELRRLNENLRAFWARAVASAKAAPSPVEAIRSPLKPAIAHLLMPGRARIAEAAILVVKWLIASRPKSGEEAEWLARAAALLEPFMPNCALALGRAARDLNAEALMRATPALSAETLGDVEKITARTSSTVESTS